MTQTHRAIKVFTMVNLDLIQLLYGLLVCYCHLEKSFLSDFTKLTLLKHYIENYTKQHKIKVKKLEWHIS
jgi:hypothetical protein